jgi:hypothetical protein
MRKGLAIRNMREAEAARTVCVREREREREKAWGAQWSNGHWWATGAVEGRMRMRCRPSPIYWLLIDS